MLYYGMATESDRCADTKHGPRVSFSPINPISKTRILHECPLWNKAAAETGEESKEQAIVRLVSGWLAGWLAGGEDLIHQGG